jgi:hypothetical protein
MKFNKTHSRPSLALDPGAAGGHANGEAVAWERGVRRRVPGDRRLPRAMRPAVLHARKGIHLEPRHGG